MCHFLSLRIIYRCGFPPLLNAAMRRLALLWFVVAFVSACSNLGQPDSSAGVLENTSVISVAQPSFTLTPAARIGWREDMRLIADNQDEQLKELARLMSQVIEQDFMSKGFRLVGSKKPRQYELLAAIIVGETPGDDPLAATLNLNTGQYDDSYGTLGMAVRRTGQNRDLWRGAIRLGLRPDLSIEDRRARSEAAVKVLMQRLPH